MLGLPGGGGDGQPEPRDGVPALQRGDPESGQLLPGSWRPLSRQHRQADALQLLFTYCDPDGCPISCRGHIFQTISLKLQRTQRL
jgi:hypothetical protein